MSSALLRRGCAALTSLALAGSVALLVPASADAAPAAKRNFGGSAYGSAAKVGNEVNLGRTASQSLCTVRPGVTRTNETAASDLDELGSVGAQVTTLESKQSGSTQSSTTTTTTAGVRLLNGANVPVVTAQSVKTIAKVIFRDGRYERQASTTFVGLRVNNQPVADQTPAPNTEIEIPLVGRVILNQQSSTDSFKIHAQTVNGLRLVVDSPTLGRGLVSVAYAQASLSSPTFARAFGNAYATQVRTGNTVRSGATANVYLPCGGTNGATRTNNIAGVGPLLDGLVGTGVATTTARSTDSASAGTNATTTARVEDVNLLEGLITADVVRANASTTQKGSSVVRSSAGTTIVNLKIDDEPVTIEPRSNQRIELPGIGDLYLKRVITDSSGLQVYALQLVVRSASSGLPVGTTINVGAAKAGVTTTN